MFRGIRFALATAVLAASLVPIMASGARAEETPATDTQAVTAAAEQPQVQKDKHWKIMPTVSTFMPVNDKTKDRFGNSWTNIGFVAGMGIGDRMYDKLEFHIDGIMRKSGDNHAYMFPAGIIYTTRPAKMKSFSPYLGASADVYFIDVKSEEDNIDSSWRTSLGGSLFAGLDVSDHVSIRASYMAIPKVESFNLSGFNLMATVGF